MNKHKKGDTVRTNGPYKYIGKISEVHVCDRSKVCYKIETAAGEPIFCGNGEWWMEGHLDKGIALTYTHAIQNAHERVIFYTMDKVELAKKHFLEMKSKSVHLNPVSSYEFDFTNYKYKR